MGDNDSSQTWLINIKKYEQQKCENMFSKLHKCGFSPQRCMKALVATGLSSERIAGEWLAAHIDDPELDMNKSRDFYISLCPKSGLLDAVNQFWGVCKVDIGWGPAQEYLPHVTIIPRFQLDDSKVVLLHHVLRNRLVCQPLNQDSLSLSLEPLSTCDPLDSKKCFLGYQAAGQARSVLESFSNALLKDLDAIGIDMDESVRRSRKGIFHLSLAYGFCASQLAALTSHMSSLVEPWVTDEPIGRWELCLFSCDGRMTAVEELLQMRCPARQSLQSVGADSGSLDYYTGDLVGLVPSSHRAGDQHGLVTGINSCTGSVGTFLIERGERVPISSCWVTHLRLPLDIIAMTSASSDASSDAIDVSISKSDKTARRVFIMRHGERVDFCFRNWISKSFDSKGVYRRHNLNMPPVLPRRKPEQFFHDCPLTVIGSRVAYETGLALRRAGVSFRQCYSSPALRCVQTAASCLRGLCQEDIGIRIEPLLFEWLGWYKGQVPQFLNAEQLHAEGLPVQTRYTSVSRLADLRPTETPSQYYERKGRLVKRLVDQNKAKGTTLLIIGHAASLDVCTRPLVQRTNWPPQISDQEFHSRSAVVPFCGIVVAEERTLRWQLVDSPIAAFTHCKNGDFSWRDALLSN